MTLELEKVGLRLNKPKPNISITINKIGGIKYFKKVQNSKKIELKSIKTSILKYFGNETDLNY